MLRILGKIHRLGLVTEPLPRIDDPALTEIGEQLRAHVGERFGGSLAIREVDAGSCNGCELEIQALNNPYYNIEGIGIKFVASPRHADLLLVTGPVSANMEEALKRTFDAVPDPKIVIAVGDCGACGGIFGKSYASRGAIADVIPVNHSVKGCPPSPTAILQAILQTIQPTTT